MTMTLSPELEGELQNGFDAAPAHAQLHVLSSSTEVAVALGLIHGQDRIRDFRIDALTCTMPRVAGFEDGKPVLGEIVKLKTMRDLTDEGEAFMQQLLSQSQGELTSKQLSDWRIANRFMRLLRKTSLDEMPQLVFNVMGVGHNLFEGRELMNMRLFGSARPSIPDEILVDTDNSNDVFCRALETVGKRRGIGTMDDVMELVRTNYVPALISPATAEGFRQRGTPKDDEAYIEGILDYAAISELPCSKRALARASMFYGTAKHVMLGTDAA